MNIKAKNENQPSRDLDKQRGRRVGHQLRGAVGIIRRGLRALAKEEGWIVEEGVYIKARADRVVSRTERTVWFLNS